MVVGKETVVLKLGGSLITRKDKPLTPNLKAIRAIARSIWRASLAGHKNDLRLFLVHGGGSFGHYYAKKYHLSSKRFVEDNSIGVSRTASAMQEIHTIILRELVKNGVNCKTIDASELLNLKGNELSRFGERKLRNYFNEGLVPVSFGNVLVTAKGATIVSGDTLCSAFVKRFPTERVIFAMDVDGIYMTPQLKGEILPLVSPSATVTSALRKFDVTGGVQSKLGLGFEMSARGANIFFLNGAKGTRLTRCIRGDLNVKATRIPPRFSARLKNGSRKISV